MVVLDLLESNKLIKSLEYKLTFGKYKGKTLNNILSYDASYILWANKNVKWFKLSEKLYQTIKYFYRLQKRSFYEWQEEENPYGFGDWILGKGY